MNKNILQKILTELGKETPSIDYLKGMVETLLEMGEPEIKVTGGTSSTVIPYATQTTPTRTESVSDESTTIPDFLKTGPLGTITN